MPVKLKEFIRSTIDAAKAKDDGHEFPAVHMKKIMERYVNDNVLL